MSKFLVKLIYSLLWNGVGSMMCFWVAESCKGTNYSDTGVPLYSNSGLAFLGGITIYLILIILGFLISKRINILKQITVTYLVLAGLAIIPIIWILTWVVNL